MREKKSIWVKKKTYMEIRTWNKKKRTWKYVHGRKKTYMEIRTWGKKKFEQEEEEKKKNK